MDATLGEWLNLVIRWIHVITGIAWIGASFYFNWLLNRLVAPRADDERVLGNLWAIHAGGFFRVQKRRIPAGELPEPLHWFKWEAYWTWISGFALLVLVYYVGARVYLVDPVVADMSPAAAVAVGLVSLVGSWFVYDLLWRSPLGHRRILATAISCLLLALLTYALCRVFSGRGAYIHVGAVLGTLMVGNVFRVIMPAQRELVAATRAGREQNEALSAASEQRSLHNNYLTLPVLFVMVSNHYPATFGHPLNWLVLLVLFAAGGLVRHYFNVRHRSGNWASSWLLALAAVAVAGVAYLTAAGGARTTSAAGPPVRFAEVRAIVDRHCLSCHSATPTHELFTTAPKNVVFDTPEQIRNQAPQIRAQTVTSRAMPLGNLSAMSLEEREALARWIAQGAELD